MLGRLKEGSWLLGDGTRQVTLGEVFPGVIVRTTPNAEEKRRQKWNGTNPPFFTVEAMKLLAETHGFQHLLVDLPSVDRESDEGKLQAHAIFFGFSKKEDGGGGKEVESDENFSARSWNSTITELCYVDNQIPNGPYLLNLQVAPFHHDAAPCRPIIYPLHENL